MLKKQIFFAVICGIEIVILMVLAKILFFNQSSFSQQSFKLQTQTIPQNSISNTNAETNINSTFSKWEYKTLIILYRVNSSISPLGKRDTQSSFPSIDIMQLAQSNSIPPCMVEDSDSDLISLLNLLGNDGWELVSVTTADFYSFFYIFKRGIL
jgi:hypothetical protein